MCRGIRSSCCRSSLSLLAYGAILLPSSCRKARRISPGTLFRDAYSSELTGRPSSWLASGNPQSHSRHVPVDRDDGSDRAPDRCRHGHLRERVRRPAGDTSSVSRPHMLRAISVFILAVSAFSLVRYTGRPRPRQRDLGPDTRLLPGCGGFSHPAKGSFLTASIFLSLLVIPVIARATEEGLRSIPRDIREGSTGAGGHGWARAASHSLAMDVAEHHHRLAARAGRGGGQRDGAAVHLRERANTASGPGMRPRRWRYLIFDAGRGRQVVHDGHGPVPVLGGAAVAVHHVRPHRAALFLHQRFAGGDRAWHLDNSSEIAERALCRGSSRSKTSRSGTARTTS